MGWPVYLINSTLCMSLWVSLTYFVEPPYKVSLYPPSTIGAAMFKMGLQLTKAIRIWYILLKICVGLVSGPNLIQYSYHFQYNMPCAMHLILKVILKVICVRDWEYNTDESALEFGLHIHWSVGWTPGPTVPSQHEWPLPQYNTDESAQVIEMKLTQYWFPPLTSSNTHTTFSITCPVPCVWYLLRVSCVRVFLGLGLSNLIHCWWGTGSLS